MEVPGGVQELVEEQLGEGACGLEFGDQLAAEGFEVLAFLVGDDELAGGEAVAEGVAGAAGLAFGGAGAGGAPGVFAVGGDLCRRGHGRDSR